VRAVRSSSPSRRGEKAQLKTGKDGRGKTVMPNAILPQDAEVGEWTAPHVNKILEIQIPSTLSFFRVPSYLFFCGGASEETWRQAARARTKPDARYACFSAVSPPKHDAKKSQQALTFPPPPLHPLSPTLSRKPPPSPPPTDKSDVYIAIIFVTATSTDDDASMDEGSVFDELSAKVAQLQAALAEVDNVGVMDPENLARLEEGYLRGSYDSGSEDDLDGGVAVATSAAARKRKTAAAGRKRAAPAKAAPTTTGITTGVEPAVRKPRGRPKGSKGRVKAAAAGGGGVVGAAAATEVAVPKTTRAGNVVRRGGGNRVGARPRGGGKQTDSMKTYLKDIGTVSLLTGEQEVELAKRIQDLMYLDGVRETLAEELDAEPSSFEWACAANVSETELQARLEEGKRAKNQMIQANLRLVVSIAKRYANKSMSFQDLIQEGCVGLIRGAEKFDHKRGYKFSTYAHWWIRQAVTRSISDQSRTIRLPVHLFEIISRMSKVERQMVMKHGRDPTTEEMAEALDMTVEKIKQIKKASLVPISLNQTMNDDDKRTVEDTLIDDNTEHPDDATGKVLLKEDLENVLNTLNPRERDVLRLRYGLDDGRVKTLEEIGNVFSVTRERIRQIEAKALRKLRQPSRNGILREYLPSDHEAQVDGV
jgi:RNA polymerase primary sigma factor